MIDDIDDRVQISETYILSKLKNQQDWIRQISCITKAIPNQWLTIISQDNSIKTKVHIHNTINSLKIMLNKEINSKMSTKQMYNIIINENKPDKPIGVIMWEKYLPKTCTSN